MRKYHSECQATHPRAGTLQRTEFIRPPLPEFSFGSLVYALRDDVAGARLVGSDRFNFQKPFLIEDSRNDDRQRRTMCAEDFLPNFSV